MAWDRTLLVGVRDNQTGIDRKAFAADEARRDASLHHALEHAPKDITLAEPLVARARERGMIGDLVLDAQAAEPAIGQVHLYLTAQQPLRSDRKNIADEQHPDHQHRIDRWASPLRVVGRKLCVDPRKV